MKSLRATALALVALSLLVGCRQHRGAAPEPTAPADAIGAAVTRLLHSAATEGEHDAAVDALAALGPAAVPHLSEALADPKEEIRLAAVEALGKMRGQAVVDALLVALNDRSPDVRLNAVEALGTIADRRAVQPLLRQFAKDGNPQVRYECLTSLGLIGDPAATDVLVKGTSNGDPYVRMWAIDALCQMNDPHAPALAVALLHDPNHYVRDHVIQACADAFDTADGRRTLIGLAIDAPDFPTTVWARRHLTSFLAHDADAAQLTEQVRTAARQALQGPHAVRAALLLGELGDRAATEPLIAGLRDPDYLIRHHAATLLAKLRDRRAVPALIATLSDKVDLVAATAFNSLQWFADDGDPRAQEAVRNYNGKRFTERLPR